jgi:hypothetical protein
MAVKVDLTGFKNGRLTVISLHSTGYRTKWNCLCECGKTFISESYTIKTGKVKSCGCIRVEKTISMRTIHGYRDHPLYDIWCHMKDRCLNSKNPAYHNYGGRGITVCDEWVSDVKCFIDWCLNNGWESGLEIDREDNDKGYSPINCRIVTSAVNSYNRRTNVRIEYKGRHYNTKELEAINGIPANRILRRIRDYKWSVEDAISRPVRIRSI